MTRFGLETATVFFKLLAKTFLTKPKDNNSFTQQFPFRKKDVSKKEVASFDSCILYVNCLSLDVVSEVECGCESEGVSCLSTSSFGTNLHQRFKGVCFGKINEL